MTQHPQQPVRRDAVAARSLPIGEIWSKFTSDLGGILTGTNPSPPPSAPAPTDTEPSPQNAPPLAQPTTEMTTAVITTVWRTSLVTVRLTTDVVHTPTINPQYPDPTSSEAISSSSFAQASSFSGFPASSSYQLSDTVSSSSILATVTGHTTLPTSFATRKPLASSTASPDAAATSPSGASRKHAIIGGLAGSIAGLILIGLIVAFCWRRRRDRSDDGASTSEKGIRPALAKKWSEMTMREPVPNPVLPASQGTSTPDIDGGLIRVSLDRWPRPYAYGEGYRESMGPRRLQVMNPSPSRPTTPLPPGSSDSAPGFLSRQKTALAGVFTVAGTRSRANSNGESPTRGPNLPTIAVDPALSTECIAPNAVTPSFRSYAPSVSTMGMVEQRAPEDPFLTPPDERAEDEHNAAQQSPRRPGVMPLQSAAGAAGRTLSNLGTALNPFKSKPHLAESVSSVSRNSSFTSSSAGDQFQFDRPSIRTNDDEDEGVREGRWTVYEGT